MNFVLSDFSTLVFPITIITIISTIDDTPTPKLFLSNYQSTNYVSSIAFIQKFFLFSSPKLSNHALHLFFSFSFFIRLAPPQGFFFCLHIFFFSTNASKKGTNNPYGYTVCNQIICNDSLTVPYLPTRGGIFYCIDKFPIFFLLLLLSILYARY